MNTFSQQPTDGIHANIQVRKNLDFKLAETPRFWFGGNPAKTRLFDALSISFPDGERYFISSVRLFRPYITDAALIAKVTEFIQQEAQHGMAHDHMNQLMRQQGVPVDQILRFLNIRFNILLKHRPATYNIAITAACEHLTALMADAFYRHKDTMQDADPHVRALFAWHAIEEMEHRDVAYDVMQDVAHVPYLLRALALLITSALMGFFTLQRANIMLKSDGFNMLERVKLLKEGVTWAFGKQGTLNKMKQPYLNWFKRDFHPSQHPVIAQYAVWLDTLATTNDPIKAGEAFWAAGQ